ALTVFGASGPMPWIIASPCSGRSAEAAGGAPAARRPGHGPLRPLGNLLGAPALRGANFRVEIVRCYLMRPPGRDRERTRTQLRPAKQTAFNPSSMRLTARLPFGAMANDRMGMIGHYRGAENTPAALPCGGQQRLGHALGLFPRQRGRLMLLKRLREIAQKGVARRRVTNMRSHRMGSGTMSVNTVRSFISSGGPVFTWADDRSVSLGMNSTSRTRARYTSPGRTWKVAFHCLRL